MTLLLSAGDEEIPENHTNRTLVFPGYSRSQSSLCQSVPDIREQFPSDNGRDVDLKRKRVRITPWIRRVIYYLYFILYLD